jgi:flagellar hook protein FlgE
VYDTLGVAHTMTMYFHRASAGGPWNVHGTMDGATPQAFPSTLSFNTSGALTTAMPLVLPSWALTTGAATPWSPGSMDFAGTTQYGSSSSVDRLTQGGYTTGSLTGLSVSGDGVVQGRYSNGQSRNLGQVVLATFANPNGLQSLGNNQWALTSDSGPELVSAPGTGSRGVLQSASVEESNVDLTKQLVDMITQQRNYQANAQTIKTQDQILQTLVNLR